jgi:solute carrier family 34 (sodium-dependent phosphate cotransporter)
MTDTAKHTGHGERFPKWARVLLAIGFLYVFLVGVGLLEHGIRAFGEGFEERLLASFSNPLAGLLAGIAATVIVQSSSISTATIVGLVGAGVLPVGLAVPMIMGANIGTTVTNTLVSLTSLRRPEEFRRAFAAATMHDFFNIIAVAVLFPLELATGFLSRAALWLGGLLRGAEVSGVQAQSPIKEGVGAGVGLIEGGVEWLVPAGVAFGVVLLLLGLSLLFLSLRLVTMNMRQVLAGRVEQAMNRVLHRGAGVPGILIGIVITVLVMTSTITTSILVPMVAAGVLTTRNAYPITLGANIGTTATALIASLAVELPEGLVIALVHMLFNLTAIAIVYPIPKVRYIPVRLAEALAGRAVHNRSLVAAYVGGLFVAAPLLGVLVLS